MIWKLVHIPFHSNTTLHYLSGGYLTLLFLSLCNILLNGFTGQFPVSRCSCQDPVGTGWGMAGDSGFPLLFWDGGRVGVQDLIFRFQDGQAEASLVELTSWVPGQHYLLLWCPAHSHVWATHGTDNVNIVVNRVDLHCGYPQASWPWPSLLRASQTLHTTWKPLAPLSIMKPSTP